MQAELQSPLRKLVFLVICWLLIFLYLTQAWRTAVAAWAARTQQISGWERAAALEPGNAEHWQNLGRSYTLVLHDLDKGRASYETATSLNPYKARYWLDLALVHQLSGDVQQESRALERALEAEPTTPNVAWEAASLYVVQGNWESALPLFRVVLQRDPVLRRQALELALRSDRDVNQLLDQVVPPGVPAYVDFLTLLVQRKDDAAAGAVWTRLIALGQPVPLPSALPYLNLLLSQQQGDRARQAWQELARVTPALSRYLAPGNLVTNGGFEEDILGSGLDWRVRPQAGTELRVEEDQAHSGNRSLRIRFRGANIGPAGVAQLIPLQPSTSYSFAAYVKTDSLEGVNGPRLQIVDATGTSLFLGDELSGTQPWRAVLGEFSSGPQTQVVILRVARVPSLGQAQGTLWLDSVRLQQLEHPGADQSTP